MDLSRLLQGAGGGGGGEVAQADTSEQVYVSSLALLKMLAHGRAGVPMEVMGLMLGEFIDDYTIRCCDVFSMPQSGTSVSVEAVDPVYQTTMLDMLKQVGRPEMVVGWYHSHPGFGCWFSGVDVNTQQSFEALNSRAVGIVVDPIQSVKGKVVIDCFRSINPQIIMMGGEPRQTTSNVGHINLPSIQALIHGLNRHYYSIVINWRKTDHEQKMLLNLHKPKWQDGLAPGDFQVASTSREETMIDVTKMTDKYIQMVDDELKYTPEELIVRNTGKTNPKKRIEQHIDALLTTNILLGLGTMLDTVVF